MNGVNAVKRDKKKEGASIKFANAYITDVELPLVGTSTGVSFGRHHFLCPEARSNAYTGCITYVTMKAGPSPVALTVSNYVLDEVSGIISRQPSGRRGDATTSELAEIMHQLIGSSLLFSFRSFVYSEEEESFKRAPLKLGVPNSLGEKDTDTGVERVTSLISESIDVLHTTGGFLSFVSAVEYSSLKRMLKGMPSIPVNGGSNGWDVPYVEVLAYRYHEEEKGTVIYPPLEYHTAVLGYPIEGRDGWVYATALLPEEGEEESEFATYLIKMRRKPNTEAVGGEEEFEVRIIDKVPDGLILVGPDLDYGSVEKRAVFYDIVSESYVACEPSRGEHMKMSCTVIADEMSPYPAVIWQGWLIALSHFSYRVYSGKAGLMHSVEQPEEVRSAMRIFPALEEMFDYLKGKTIMGNPIEIFPSKWNAEYRLRARVRLSEDKAVFMYKSMVVTFNSKSDAQTR